MNDFELWIYVNGGEYTIPMRFKADKVEDIGFVYNPERRVYEYHLVIDGKLFVLEDDCYLCS